MMSPDNDGPAMMIDMDMERAYALRELSLKRVWRSLLFRFAPFRYGSAARCAFIEPFRRSPSAS